MGRWVITSVFLLLAGATAAGVLDAWEVAWAEASVKSAAVVGYSVLKLGVVLAFSVFVFMRDPARRPSREPIAFAVCAAAVGSLVLLQRPSASASAPLVVAGDLVTLASCAWLLVAVLALGRCFGVLPEARGLVMHGPYRLVRHPVYLGELGACAGLVIAAPTAWNLTAAALFAAAQAARMRLEEAALLAEFPQYARYAARTPRLVPRPFVPSHRRLASSRIR